VSKIAENSEKYGMKWKSHVKRFGGYIIDLDEQEMFGDLQEGVWRFARSCLEICKKVFGDLQESVLGFARRCLEICKKVFGSAVRPRIGPRGVFCFGVW
jgi:hypothetical protein